MAKQPSSDTSKDAGRKLFVGPRFRRIRQQLNLSQTQIAEGLGVSPSYINLIERVRDLLEANRNYFPELEQAAETLRDEISGAGGDLFAQLSERFREKHSGIVRIMPVDVMRETLRRWDRHRRQLLISELIE